VTRYAKGEIVREIDLDIVETLARVGCTQEEIAHQVGVKPNHFCELKKKRPEIQEALDRGKADLHKSIRRAQVKAGVEDGNVPMLIHLGKAYLGQSEKLNINQTLSGDMVIVTEFGQTGKLKPAEDSEDSSSESA
jgi:UV DNA damage repair endonuclease